MNSIRGLCIVKNKITLKNTEIVTGFNSTFFTEISFLSPVKIYTPNVQFIRLNTARITEQ